MLCPQFSVNNTDSAQNNNIQICRFGACQNDIIVASLCSADGGSCQGDTFLRLLDQNNVFYVEGFAYLLYLDILRF
jgi:hypothetical protein